LAVCYSVFSLGMLLAFPLLGRIRSERGRPALAWVGIGLAGLCMVAMGLARAPYQLWLVEFVLGLSIMIWGVLWEGQLQSRVPAEAMGRIGAVDEVGRSVLYPLGLVAVGVLARTYGSVPVMAAGGVLTLLFGLLGRPATHTCLRQSVR
jgi:hypothetical protein